MNTHSIHHVCMPHCVPGIPVVQQGRNPYIGTHLIFQDYTIMYPKRVLNALQILYQQYNRAFLPLVEANREHVLDYKYCMHNGLPVNYFVQIDMCGLPPEFLEKVDDLSDIEIMQTVRRSIFEIENSLAVYEFLQHLFPSVDSSLFKSSFRKGLDGIRHMYGMPVALLAVTHQKYDEMRRFEFGKGEGEILTDEEVYEASGFDTLFGPDELKAHIESSGGQCGYLLYARTSDPLDKLKKPEFEVSHPLLSDPYLRRIIKEHALTLNIDNPQSTYLKKINDTKEYMPTLSMGYIASSIEDIVSTSFLAHSASGKSPAEYTGPYFSGQMYEYLVSCGISLAEIDSGTVALRCKPLKNAYGCYGHASGTIHESGFRTEVRSGLRKRGLYIVQPELQTPTIRDSTGTCFTYIDRIFFSTNGAECTFMGGFRNMIPTDSIEAKRRRIHGSSSTVYAQIV